METVAAMLEKVRSSHDMSYREMARLFNTSLISIHRWINGTAQPSPAIADRIKQYYHAIHTPADQRNLFAGHGLKKPLPLFELLLPQVELSANMLPPILERISTPPFIGSNSYAALQELLVNHSFAAETASRSPETGMSAGKNTYTYDAHTYHTKVPPQGIAELLAHYLPEGGLILDPFAGSGMTGVAARSLGYDCILNELSPAAAFIASQFTASIDPELFEAGIKLILQETQPVRDYLYSTRCRECGKTTEIQYTVWSYNVICPHCTTEFQLWDHCRSYGTKVREHKILKTFACPSCQTTLRKSSLKRTLAYPVMIGYKCCGSKQQEVTHPPDEEDLQLIHDIEQNPPLVEQVIPRHKLYDGANLRQPINHGLDSIDKLYTARNLAAMSHLWASIRRIPDQNLAAFLAFTFTSLYQRVTRLSEFRFWGGSGNTARFNVPYIFNEANVFQTFSRKARSINDHLRTTVQAFSGTTVVMNGSATELTYIPDTSIDLVFTDPPFGSNINYSEMNILWEAWLGKFTDSENEAIINKYQHKDLPAYERLMSLSMHECFRVLRPGGWMLIMFMNTSKHVWEALRNAINTAGFSIETIDHFDKQHGTFKQFVNENTAGFDLVIHCRKRSDAHQVASIPPINSTTKDSIKDYIQSREGDIPTISYIHVQRDQEIDYRQLYSEWLSIALSQNIATVDFPLFRKLAVELIAGKK